MENPLHGAKESPNGTSPSEITPPLLTFPEKEASIGKENSALKRSFLFQIFHSIFTSQKSENQKPHNRDPSSLTPLSSRAKSRDLILKDTLWRSLHFTPSPPVGGSGWNDRVAMPHHPPSPIFDSLSSIFHSLPSIFCPL